MRIAGGSEAQPLQMGMGEKAHETWNKVKLCYLGVRAVLGHIGNWWNI